MVRWKPIPLAAAGLLAAGFCLGASSGSSAGPPPATVPTSDRVVDVDCGPEYVFAPSVPMRVELVPMTGQPAPPTIRTAAARDEGGGCTAA